jgi:AraC-like DNA-binding protein
MIIFGGVAAAILICISGASAATSTKAASVKKKSAPVSASGQVFSVTIHDSAVPLPVSPSATGPSRASGKPDTVSQSVKLVKDSAKPVMAAAPAAAPANSEVQKKSADTLKNPAPPAATVLHPSTSSAAREQKPKKISASSRNRLLSVKMLALLLCAVVIFLALRFVRKQKTPPRFLTTTRLSIMDKEVRRACCYIEKNFADPDLSTEKICKDLVTGEAFLEALMERDLGVSLNDFVMHVRINRAKQILSKDPLADGEGIGRETGFSSTAAFFTAFRKLTGASFEAYTQAGKRESA